MLRGLREEVRSKEGVEGSKSGHVGLANDGKVYGYYPKCDTSPWKI